MPSPPSHNLSFTGYWRDPNKAGVPAQRGIFCVYACVFDPAQKFVSLKQLLYIGSAENAREAVASDPLRHRWEERLSPGQMLCYTFAPIPEADMQTIAAALVYRSCPALNTIPHKPSLDITVEGATALLNPTAIQ